MLKDRRNETDMETRNEMREGGKVRRRNGFKRHRATRVFALILALAMVLTSADFGAIGGAIAKLFPRGSAISQLLENAGPSKVKADDLVNTVPSDENYDTSGTVTTQMPGPGGNSSHPGTDRGNDYTHQTTKVRQSQSTSSATTFASGAPLSTIYIDQARINVPGNANPQAYIESGGSNITYKLLASDPSFAPGIVYNAGDATVNYNPNKTSGLKQLVPGSPVVMSGPLYELTFKNAAIMPDGTRMHLRVTFSDAVIYTDERLKSSDMMALPTCR